MTAVTQLNSDFRNQSFEPFNVTPPLALTNMATAIDASSFLNGGTVTGNLVITGTVTAAASAFTALTVTGNIDADATKLGFYGTAKIIKQTGVSVTAGGIHAALVNLGLIAA